MARSHRGTYRTRWRATVPRRPAGWRRACTSSASSTTRVTCLTTACLPTRPSRCAGCAARRSVVSQAPCICSASACSRGGNGCAADEAAAFRWFEAAGELGHRGAWERILEAVRAEDGAAARGSWQQLSGTPRWPGDAAPRRLLGHARGHGLTEYRVPCLPCRVCRLCRE